MENNSLWEILVPKYSNEKVEYPLGHHQAWDEEVRRISEGLTILKTAKGQWISREGELFVETMIPVRIVCDEPSIDRIIDLTMQHYDQKAVLAYEISRRVKLKHK